MAPARMMQFVDQHIDRCEICQMDPVVAEEIEKIREFVVPESKIPKAVRAQGDRPTPEISPDEDDHDDESSDKEDTIDDPDDVNDVDAENNDDTPSLDKEELI